MALTTTPRQVSVGRPEREAMQTKRSKARLSPSTGGLTARRRRASTPSSMSWSRVHESSNADIGRGCYLSNRPTRRRNVSAEGVCWRECTVVSSPVCTPPLNSHDTAPTARVGAFTSYHPRERAETCLHSDVKLCLTAWTAAAETEKRQRCTPGETCAGTGAIQGKFLRGPVSVLPRGTAFSYSLRDSAGKNAKCIGSVYQTMTTVPRR